MLKIQDTLSALLRGYMLFLIIDVQEQLLLFVNHADFESDKIVPLEDFLFVFPTP